MRDAAVGFCLASFAFLPILRSLTGIPEIAYVVPIGLLLLILLRTRPTSLLKIRRSIGIHILLGLLFCSWMIFTRLWTLSTAQVTKDTVLVVYLAAILLLGGLLSRPTSIRWTLIWVHLAGLVVAVIILADYVAQGSLRGDGSLVSEFYLVASSILGASAVGLIGYWVSAERITPVLVGAVIITFSGLALALGRMALLTAVLLTVLLGIQAAFSKMQGRRNGSGLLKGLASGVLIFLLSGGLFWGAMQVERTASRLTRLFTSLEYELTVGGRGIRWSRAWEQVGTKPLFGHGLGSSGILVSGSESGYPHNLFLQVWLDGGLVGVGLLCATVGMPIWLYFHRRNQRLRHDALPFFAMYLFYLLTYQTSSNAYTARSLILLGILVTVALAGYPSGLRRPSVRDMPAPRENAYQVPG